VGPEPQASGNARAHRNSTRSCSTNSPALFVSRLLSRLSSFGRARSHDGEHWTGTGATVCPLFVPCLYRYFGPRTSLPPSTPPSQSAPELPFGTTPVKPTPYIAMKELLAVRLAGLAPLPTTVELDEFWTETLNSFDAAQLSETDLTTLKEQYDKLALLKKTPKPSESLSYVPTTIIMNVLSLADAKARPLPDDQVVGWFLNPTQFLSGDPFAKSLKPDIVAYVVPRTIAEEYLTSLQSPKTTLSNLDELRPAWAQMISAAELNVSKPGQSQLLNYLEATCCYRPDLVSVVAISSKLAGYQFYSLNAARCLKCSDILPWEDENTPSLQKFIAAVYQTQRSRYEKINYLPKSLQAWTLEGGSESVRRWVMLPFHHLGHSNSRPIRPC